MINKKILTIIFVIAIIFMAIQIQGEEETGENLGFTDYEGAEFNSEEGKLTFTGEESSATIIINGEEHRFENIKPFDEETGRKAEIYVTGNGKIAKMPNPTPLSTSKNCLLASFSSALFALP